MNWRKPAYLLYATLRGYQFPDLFLAHVREYERGVNGETASAELGRLLRHCRDTVPYYRDWLRDRGAGRPADSHPLKCLRQLPILTKDIIRKDFSRLQSQGRSHRGLHENTSGGSTGEPVRLLQDQAYEDKSAATALFYNFLLGCDVGDPLVRLWGSERDLEEGTRSRKTRFFNWVTNTTWLNAFQMRPDRMKAFVATLNRLRPNLIVAYAQAAYELARFAEHERLPVVPQRTILTSAGTLYPFMREKIARVFGCRVFNLYGSREVSDIACELPGLGGLWVAPWANYVEIVNEEGQSLPPGTEGDIVVTCLTNYAMPLVRYKIGDRGVLLSEDQAPFPHPGTQVLKHVSGRTVDMFQTRDRTLVDGEYFTHLLYFRPWIQKFQVIQKTPSRIVFKLVRANGEPSRIELDAIAAKSREIMGADCRIDFEFPDDLPPHPSGKFRYTISEVGN